MEISKLEKNAEQEICPHIFDTSKCYKGRTEQPPVCITGYYTNCLNYQSLTKPNPNTEK